MSHGLARRAARFGLIGAVLTLAACAELGQSLSQLDTWAKRNLGGPGPSAAAAPTARPPVAGGETGPVGVYRKGDAAPAAAILRDALAELDNAGGDMARASSLLYDAANAGNADAAYLIAVTDAVRPPEQRNPQGARDWLRRAALQGHPEAQRDLGRLYADGNGVRKDDEWANVWYERAALRGDGDAAYRLALRQIAGVGTAVNLPEAYRWLVVAGAWGEARAAQYRDAVAAKLDAGERARIDAELRAAGPVGAGETYPDPPLVRYVQTALNRRGLDAGPADGRAGARTLQAIGRFRSRAGSGAEAEAAITPDLVASLRRG